MPDALTLCKGKKPCAFGEITVDADTQMAAKSRAALKALKDRYPALADLKGDEFIDHDDYLAYARDYRVEATWLPIMHAAWAGQGKPPAADDLLASYKNEVNRCLVEIVRLNPDLAEELPDAAQRLAETTTATADGGAAPND